MKTLIDWINQKWFWILIAFAVTIFIHIGLRYYFSDWSANNFNNIVTPLATIASVTLFVWLTWNQYALIQSQNLKQNLEREYALIKKGFENKIYTYEYRIGEYGLEPASKTFNSLDIFMFFTRTENDLKLNSNYVKDLTAYNDGVLYDAKHYNNHDNHHYKYLTEFLNPFAIHGMKSLNLIKLFLVRVNSFQLLKTDREYFHILIESELLTPCFIFMKTCALEPNQYLIPLINSPRQDGKVEWVSFSHSKIAEHYEFFQKHLIKV